jgi:hypothetical protein
MGSDLSFVRYFRCELAQRVISESCCRFIQ